MKFDTRCETMPKEKDPKGVEDCSPESDVPETASKVFEVILQRVGGFHKHQWKLTIMVALCAFLSNAHNISAVFLAATPDHRCEIPNFRENSQTINATFPMVRDKNGEMVPSKCKYYDHDYTTLGNLAYEPLKASVDKLFDDVINPLEAEERFCNAWVYDNSTFKSTVVTEWDLVCSNRWMMSFTQSSYMMGILIESTIFCAVSDRVGRRPVALLCGVLFLVSSVAAAFSTSFIMFLVLRFISAGATQAMYFITYILLMESVNLKGRNIMGNLSHLVMSLASVLLSICSYFINDWRHLQLAISVPSVLFLLYFWALPESPSWLLMNGMEKEGIKYLKSIAKCNGKTFPSEKELIPLMEIISEEVKEQNEQTKTTVESLKSLWENVVSLVRTPNMRRRSLISFYMWFCTTMLFYGLTFSGNNLSASVHIVAGAPGVVGMLGVVVLMFSLTKVGRKKLVNAAFFTAGASCICIIFVPTDMVWLNISLVLLGQTAVSWTSALVYLISAELFPTQVRSISIGVASLCGWTGTIIIPFIVNILGDIYYAIPSTILGVLGLLAGLLTLQLPETGNKPLPELIEEIEAMPR